MFYNISLVASLIAALLAGANPTVAQDFPSKPVRVIVTFPPGGANDAVTRLVAQKATDIWGRPVIVDFRGGAAGNIGAELVVRSPPDGHTLLLIGGSYFTNPALTTNLPFDPIKDLAPVTPATASGMLLVANPALPAKSVKELIALARKHPGKLTYASSGTGGSLHLSGELLNIMVGTKMLHVPYKGGAPALIEVIGGQVDLMFTGIPPTLPHIKTGKLRALGIGGVKRNASLPDVPTINESGVPGFEVNAHTGFLATGGTPREIVNRLNATLVLVLQSPEVQEQFAKFGVEAVSSTPEQYADYIRSEISKWAKVVKTAGIRPSP